MLYVIMGFYLGNLGKQGLFRQSLLCCSLKYKITGSLFEYSAKRESCISTGVHAMYKTLYEYGGVHTSDDIKLTSKQYRSRTRCMLRGLCIARLPLLMNHTFAFFASLKSPRHDSTQPKRSQLGPELHSL